MGVQILASGVSDTADSGGALALGVSAAKRCLARAEVAGHDVDLLIYVGIYRDDNIVEPAIAALIQRALGMSLDFAKTARAGFSFDLLNGACGVVNAMQIAAAYLHGGDVERVLIVASDAHPSGSVVEDFPFAHAGAALLLARDDSTTAPRFGRLQTRDEDDNDDDTGDNGPGVEGFLSFATAGLRGRDTITVVRDPDHEARALALLSSSIATYAAAEGLRLDETVILASCVSPTFGVQLAAQLGLAADRVVTAPGVDKGPHTAALLIAWHHALHDGRLHGTAPVLFAAVGGGLTSACIAWHR